MRDTVTTGATALDSILGGGLPKNRTVLVTGTPGTGKSTLGMQFLQDGIENDEDCLFISTEQTIDELRDSFAPFGFDLADENLTITSLHAAPGRTFESGDDELVIETFEDGETFGKGFSAAFTSKRICEVLERYGPKDRVVLDSISGLEPMAEDQEEFRRGVLDLIQLFNEEFGATSLFTAEYVGGTPQHRSIETLTPENAVQYNTHGVIRLWRERISGDYHRFLDVMKMRGVNHDTRQFEIDFVEDGVAVVPRRRVHSGEFLSHDHCRTGIPGLDELGGGGVLKGMGALLEHDGQANLDAIISSLLAKAVEDEMVITLVPTVDMKRERLAAMIRSQTDGLVDGLGHLLENDQLFVLDATGAWDGGENIFNLQHEEAGLKYLLKRIDDRVGSANHLTILNTEAKVHAVGETQARSVRYWVEANFIGPDDVLVDIHNPNVMSDSLAQFYADAAGQVFETWLEDTGLQYVRLEKGPTGQIGSSRLIEFIDEPPYVRIQ